LLKSLAIPSFVYENAVEFNRFAIFIA
jgi:hypothetical protein